MLNSIIRYFDLQSESRDVAPKGDKKPPHAAVFPQYLAVAVGVIIEPLLRKYVETGTWQVDWSAVGGRVIFGLIIAMIILPGIYKSVFDPEKPVIIQLLALLPFGIGWQTVFTSLTKIAVP